MKTMVLLIALSTATMAHAGEPKAATDGSTPGTAAGADSDGTICEKKRKTGSNRMERVCTTAEERLAAREKSHADLQRLGRCSGSDVICSGDL